MEKHFLENTVEGPPVFRAEPWYNQDGDCITYQMADEAIVAERVDDILTVYRSAIDNRPIGFQIKSVIAIIKKFGLDGLWVSSETRDGETKRISVTALLLAAYEDGFQTIGRRRAYASVMKLPPDHESISMDKLKPVAA